MAIENRAWRDVAPQAAKLERFYGLGGWLGLIYAVHAVIAAVLVLILVDAAMDPRLADGDLDARILHPALAIAVSLPFLILAPLEHPLMPPVTIAASWTGLVLHGLLSGLPVSADGYAAWIAAGMIVVLFTWYLLRSKRVNVTFRHRIPADTNGSA